MEFVKEAYEAWLEKSKTYEISDDDYRIWMQKTLLSHAIFPPQ